MPIRLGDAKIGTVVRPPKAVHMSANCLGMDARWTYVVTGKQGADEPSYQVGDKSSNKGGSYTWLTEPGKSPGYELGGDFRATDRRNLGKYQCLDDEVFLVDGDEVPARTTVETPYGVVGPGQVPPRRGAGRHYSFVWEDDDISLHDLPRQAQVIAQILYETGEREFEVEDIEKHLNARQDEIGGKQTPFKVFEFYRSKYMNKGLMTRT